MASETIVLEPGDIHFFYSRVEKIRDPLLLARYRSVISASEKAKTDRYVFEKDRHRCLVTRALVRSVLSACTGLPPGQFEFTENAYGKPALRPGCAAMPIEFNLSHCSGLTACAVALDRQIGVDVEQRRRDIDLRLADRYFTPLESGYIRNRRAGERPAAFFDIWTLKEAYIKAKGRGLSMDLDRFGFEIGQGTRIHMDASLDDRPDRWRFFRFSPETAYHAAIAVHGTAREVLNLHVHRCIPLETIEQVACTPY